MFALFSGAGLVVLRQRGSRVSGSVAKVQHKRKVMVEPLGGVANPVKRKADP